MKTAGEDAAAGLREAIAIARGEEHPARLRMRRPRAFSAPRFFLELRRAFPALEDAALSYRVRRME
jgi:hypothetical protein